MFKLSLSALLLTFFMACSHKVLNLDHHISSTMGLIPESSGHFLGGSLEPLDFHTDHKINLAKSTQTSLFGSVSDTEVSTTKSLERSGGMGIKGTLGLLKRLDYVLKSHTESPTMHGFKLQLIGDSFKEKKNGFKMALAALYGQGTDTEDGHFSISIDDQAADEFDNASGEILMKQREVALILGYRFTNFFLLFSAASYTHVDSKATLTINAKPTYVLADSEYFSGTVGGRVHTHFDKLNVFTQMEVGRSHGHILKGSSQSLDALDFSFGVAW